MNHHEAEQLLGAYQDGELDLTMCLQLEEHMAGCPSCRQKLLEEQELAGLIRTETPRFHASPFLKTRVLAALREEKPSVPKSGWWKHFSPLWAYSGLVGAAAMLFILGFYSFQNSEMTGLAREAVANHVRSLQASHLVDVESTDQHTVKPWFAGRINYSPQVIDLTSSGYPLVGGRLDVLDHRDVAAIIYKCRKHYINLFIWPSETESLHGGLSTQNGYHVQGWSNAGMNYLAVSELGKKDLETFVSLIRDQSLQARPMP